jgi:hypothetical protein
VYGATRRINYENVRAYSTHEREREKKGRSLLLLLAVVFSLGERAPFFRSLSLFLSREQTVVRETNRFLNGTFWIGCRVRARARIATLRKWLHNAITDWVRY